VRSRVRFPASLTNFLHFSKSFCSTAFGKEIDQLRAESIEKGNAQRTKESQLHKLKEEALNMKSAADEIQR
jgi:hypothetical protein